MGQMVEDLAVAEDDEAPAGDAAKELQQAPVARSVNARRPHDRQLDFRLARRRLGQALPLQLGDLIDVPRAKRRALRRRRTLDVAVHADGAAVDDATGAGSRRGAHDPASRLGVDAAIRRLGQSRLTIERGDVIDDFDSGDGRVEILAALEIAGHELDARVRKIARGGRIAHQGAHLVAAGKEMAREMAAGESGRAGDENLHRSASMVTGEPASLNTPVDASAPSSPSVKAREPMRL